MSNTVVQKWTGAAIQVEETQRYHYEGGDLIIESDTEVLGAMAGSFLNLAKYIVSPKESGSKCVIQVQVEYKGTWFKSTIEDFVYQSSVAAYDTFVELANEDQQNWIEQEKDKEKVIEKVKQVVPKELKIIPLTPIKSRRQSLDSMSNESEEEVFYDADEVLISSLDTTPSSLTELHQEITQIRTIVESTHTRLQSLEAAFGNLESVPSSDYGRKPRNLNEYFQKMEELSKQRIEEDKKVTESFNKKLNDIDSKLNQSVFPSISWMKGFGFLLFVVSWPWIANSGWRVMKSLLERRLR